jgi:hypothetical protein
MPEHWPDMKMKCEKLLCSLAFGLLCAGAALAADEDSLDRNIQTIKQQALELNRDLLILEEELLFPGDSRLTVFLSLEVGDFFQLDAVTLQIDGEQVAHYLYTQPQLDALRRGGAQQLYLGNVKIGAHQIVAVFTGKGAEDRDYQGTTALTLEKRSGANNLELEIIESAGRQQPEFAVKQW